MIKNFYEHNGITWSPILDKYRVSLTLPDGCVQHLGFFRTMEEAMTAQAIALIKTLVRTYKIDVRTQILED